MTLRERENYIFRKYRDLGHQIIRDGALSMEYETARPRLLVILKEPNDADGSFAASGGDIRDFGKTYNRAATWSNLARWSALVNNPQLRFKQIDVNDPEKRRMHLRRIAVVNLKKTSGQSTSRNSKIKASAEQHWKLLQDQFRLYKPDVTITGNVFAIIRDLMGKTEQGGGGKCFHYFKDQDLGICFDFYHPQQRTHSNVEIFKLLKRELNYHGLSR